MCMMNKLKDETPKILKDFAKYLYDLNYSKGTIDNYILNLILFFRFLKDYFKLSIEVKDFTEFILLQVKANDIYAYMIYLNYNKDNSSETRALKLTAIKCFYTWLCRKFPNRKDPAKNIRNPEKVFKLPKYLNLEQAKKIQIIFTKDNSKFPERNNAIISLFLSTGMRLSELHGININDINFSSNKINIVGKGNKERTVYFSNSCKEKLIKYLKTRSKDTEYLKSNEPLFLSKRKQRVSKREIQTICQNAFNLLNLGKHYSTHSLRHTAATLIYKYSNENILVVKEFLGHENVKSTQIYTHVESKELRRAVNSNPLNHIE